MGDISPIGDDTCHRKKGAGADRAAWTVRIVHLDGTVGESPCTSDPFAFDTDDDGVNERTEGIPGAHPRGGDDGNDLSDVANLNRSCTDPTLQGGDGNGPLPRLEFPCFRPPPILADNGGHQLLGGEHRPTEGGAETVIVATAGWAGRWPSAKMINLRME